MLTHRVIEVKTDADRAAAHEDGMMEVAVTKGQKGFLGVSFKYGAEKDGDPHHGSGAGPGDRVPLDLQPGSATSTTAPTTGARHLIGVLAGKDEIKLSDANLIRRPGTQRWGRPSIKGIMEQAFPRYKFEDVELRSGDADIAAPRTSPPSSAPSPARI